MKIKCVILLVCPVDYTVLLTLQPIIDDGEIFPYVIEHPQREYRVGDFFEVDVNDLIRLRLAYENKAVRLLNKYCR